MTNFIRIALTFQDSTIGIMSFVTNDGTLKREPSPEEIDNEIKKSGFEQPVLNWRVIDESEIPKDRTFRNALIDTGKLEYDIERVKVIHIDHIREERAYLLTKLDRDATDALIAGDIATADAIEAERQRLRDLPAILIAAMADAKTIEEVVAFTVEYKK